MGLLTCAKCGCSMTAEIKKRRYVYYHCTNFRGKCPNTYIREEALSGLLLCDVIKPIQIPPDVAEHLATAMRVSDAEGLEKRAAALRQLEQRRRIVIAKQDRAYEDFVEGKITNDFWSRKSQQWEEELRTIDAERLRLDGPHAPLAVNAEKILELAKKAEILYKSQNPSEQR